MPQASNITRKDVMDVLDYKPETGEFFWKKKTSWRTNIGDKAGRTHKRGYVIISIKYRSYLAHRLAWLIMTGEWPEFEVDHKDLNTGNNKWENLRAATHSQNMHNKSVDKRNGSGVKGVSWNKSSGLWTAEIVRDGKRVYCSYFKSLQDAEKAILLERAKWHGEFARSA